MQIVLTEIPSMFEQGGQLFERLSDLEWRANSSQLEFRLFCRTGNEFLHCQLHSKQCSRTIDYHIWTGDANHNHDSSIDCPVRDERINITRYQHRTDCLHHEHNHRQFLLNCNACFDGG